MSNFSTTKGSVKVSASLLGVSNYGNLNKLIKAVDSAQNAGCNELHLDITDGHFAPNIGFLPKTVEYIRRFTTLPIEVHMMVQDPLSMVKDFANAGANIFSVHLESKNANTAIKQSVELGLIPSLVLLPNTPIEKATPTLVNIQRIVLLAVKPGFSGQKMDTRVITKLSNLHRQTKDSHTLQDIAIDGGVNFQTANMCIKAGFNFLVSGSFLFKAKDMRKAVKQLQSSYTDSDIITTTQ